MAIEVHEQLQTLRYARNRWIPKSDSGKTVNPSTVVRWIRDGLQGLDGKRIRLEVTYRGQTPFTTQEAVQRFFAAVTDARLARIARTQQRADDVTDYELQSVGLTAHK
ncbi:MAG TPA: hypothetical protein PLY87_16745 [Planctomycetaceae bacterium]|nr:hypothetical protein [Planctomycetaceae bacterium]HQZ66744.1 hypothetical protein [Planctomycetaceae bacterium]